MDLLELIECKPDFGTTPYVYNGHHVPRVTVILGDMTREEYLIQWSNSLGFKHKSYREELNRAAMIGTLGHKFIEKILKGLDINIDNIKPEYKYTLQNIINSFNLWYDNIKDRSSIISTELPLICQYYGGTCDLIINIDGKVWLVDFKTSNHIGYSYFLQLAAYDYILKQQNINIDGCLILQLNKNDTGFKEYILDFSNINHLNYFTNCGITFHSMVHSYYYKEYIKQQYQSIIGG